jgi:hypothetical protein
MKRACLVAVSCVTVLAFALSTRAGTLGEACTPGVKTIAGFQARVFCGTAKVAVTVNGRSVTIRGGACERYSTYFLVNIGTAVTGTGKNRPKLAYFGLLMGRSPAYAEPAVTKPGTYRRGTITINGRGAQVDLHNEPDLRITIGRGMRSGTFSATKPGSPIYGTPTYTVKGSFTC